MQGNKTNLIVEMTFNFALKVIKYVEALEKMHQFVIGRQLLRCGTGIGANVREAQNAESRADFIHKMKLAAKEADETEYWLMLCDKADRYPNCDELLSDCFSIVRVLSKIISSSKATNGKPSAS
jgi:four helix bundle protein